MTRHSGGCGEFTTRSVKPCVRSGCRAKLIRSITKAQADLRNGTTMQSMPSRSHERWTHVSRRSDIYGRPDLYDMEYEGASNQDAHFFARLLARVRPRRVLELARGSGRVTFTLGAALRSAVLCGADASHELPGQACVARAATGSQRRRRVWFLQGAMRRWPGSRYAFDAVIVACCSVSHLITLDDRRRTWAEHPERRRP